MFPAIERTAEHGPAVVDRASRVAQIDARALWSGLEQEHGVSGAVGRGSAPVGVDVVSQFRMQEEALVTLAAFGTTAARHFGLFAQSQGSF